MSSLKKTMIRQDTDYALRMLMVLCEHSEKGISAGELSQRVAVPHGFAQKILRKLSVAGLLEAQPGRGGGFRLARKPAKIALMDVVSTIQGRLLLNRCMTGPAGCDRQPTCPISASLRSLQGKLDGVLGSITLLSLLERPSGGSRNVAIDRTGGRRIQK